jgi:hypothetical protein
LSAGHHLRRFLWYPILKIYATANSPTIANTTSNPGTLPGGGVGVGVTPGVGVGAGVVNGGIVDIGVGNGVDSFIARHAGHSDTSSHSPFDLQ